MSADDMLLGETDGVPDNGGSWLDRAIAPVVKIDPNAYTNVHETGGSGLFTVTIDWSDGTVSHGEPQPTPELAVVDALEAPRR